MRDPEVSSFDNRKPGEQSSFGDLGVGDEFFFSNYARSGILSDLDKPGSVLYVKLSARLYKRADNGALNRIGRIACKVWEAQVSR